MAALRLSIATLVVASLTLPSLAAETVSQQSQPADRCTKTAGALGAVMGHTPETGRDGRPAYRFQIRTNGLDYEAVCDAETGVIADVVPRVTH